MCVVSAMEGFISLTVHFKKTTIKTMGSAPSNVAHEDHHHVYTLYCGEKARKIQAVTDHWQPVFCCVANNQKKTICVRCKAEMGPVCKGNSGG